MQDRQPPTWKVPPSMTPEPTASTATGSANSDFFASWCGNPAVTTLGNHTSRVLVSKDDSAGVEAIIEIMPTIYAKTTTLALIAEDLGKEGVAELLRNKIPTKRSSRSGDMGEILGTAYVQNPMGYETGPSRLIERDHQDWAMRGDDALGARWNNDEVEVVKVESKSRSKADKKAVTDARKGLARNQDLPSAHSTTQFAERLLETNEPLGRAVLRAQLIRGFRPPNITHVMFIFAGNNPATAIREDLTSYSGKIRQQTVTVQVKAHQDFIRNAYELTVNDAT